MSCRQGSSVDACRYTTRRGNAHETDERKVLYPWHPWAGCIVHIHEVIEKVAGDVFRCSHDDGASGRLLELPIWMFDRAACAPMRVETFPQADIAALQALRALLDAAIGGVAVASSNAPVSGAARVSHDQNRGEVHVTPTAASTRPSKRDAAIRSVRYDERRQRGTDAGMADAASANAPGSDGADDAAERAHHHVDCPARRERDDHPDRRRGVIGLREASAAEQTCRQCRGDRELSNLHGAQLIACFDISRGGFVPPFRQECHRVHFTV